MLIDVAAPKPRKKLIIQTIYRFPIKIDPVFDNGVEKDLYRWGTYEKGTLHIMDNIVEAGDHVIDIGANIGLMTIFLARKTTHTGKVYAFEANNKTASILTENINLNQLTQVRVFNFALGSQESSAPLYSNTNHNRGSASFVNLNTEVTKGDMVEIKRLDQIDEVLENNIKLIKMDIEGWELEALKGCVGLFNRGKAPILIVEYNNERPTHGGMAVDIYEFIRKYQYRIFKSELGSKRKSKLIEVNAEGNLPYNDNLYCFPNDYIIPKKILR